MKLKLEEKPGEWRKQAWLGALGLAFLASALRWRHVLTVLAWEIIVATMLILAIVAWLFPWWFRPYYRFSKRAGFVLAKVLGCIILALMFVLVVTPMALLLRLFGKDSLQLKPVPSATPSLWRKAEPSTPLERLF